MLRVEGLAKRYGQAGLPEDTISILSDTNRDGVMDRKHVFADKLELVTSFVFHGRGVIAAVVRVCGGLLGVGGLFVLVRRALSGLGHVAHCLRNGNGVCCWVEGVSIVRV